jgi:radical SAM protein with 4Fe4S-binding SPASM domain
LYKKPVIFEVDKIEPKRLKKALKKIKETARRRNITAKFVPDTFSETDLIDYYSQKIDYSRCDCRLPWNLMYISPGGEVYPCFNYKIGNVRDENINKLWNNYMYKKFRKEIKRIGAFPGCSGCCNMIYREEK